jgi:hypothetical protein
MRQAIHGVANDPTLCVFVIITGPSRTPDSSSHVVPVISPLPFSENQPPNTGSRLALLRGNIAVTRYRTRSDLEFPKPEISVVYRPRRLDVGDRVELSRCAVERHPRSRARGFACAPPRRNEQGTQREADR